MSPADLLDDPVLHRVCCGSAVAIPPQYRQRMIAAGLVEWRGRADGGADPHPNAAANDLAAEASRLAGWVL